MQQEALASRIGSVVAFHRAYPPPYQALVVVNAQMKTEIGEIFVVFPAFRNV